MTKAPEQLMEHRVQKAFAISMGREPIEADP